MKTQHTATSPRSGFSLLEVLVASAVLSVVLMILLGVLSTTLNIWRATEGKTASDREARAAELLLTQDLANIIIPADLNLWPRLQSDRLQFLTLKPLDYQSEDGDVGDICFVEYYFDRPSNRLLRLFLGSRATYDFVLSPGQFPAPGALAGQGGGPQVLADNILPNAVDAVRGLAVANEANNTNFVLLGPRLLPMTGVVSPTNFPRAIEVNFAVADPQGIDSLDLLSNPGYRLRNAGLYSFRVLLPKPFLANP